MSNVKILFIYIFIFAFSFSSIIICLICCSCICFGARNVNLPISMQGKIKTEIAL